MKIVKYKKMEFQSCVTKNKHAHMKKNTLKYTTKNPDVILCITHSKSILELKQHLIVFTKKGK